MFSSTGLVNIRKGTDLIPSVGVDLMPVNNGSDIRENLISDALINGIGFGTQ